MAPQRIPLLDLDWNGLLGLPVVLLILPPHSPLHDIGYPYVCYYTGPARLKLTPAPAAAAYGEVGHADRRATVVVVRKFGGSVGFCEYWEQLRV